MVNFGNMNPRYLGQRSDNELTPKKWYKGPKSTYKTHKKQTKSSYLVDLSSTSN